MADKIDTDRLTLALLSLMLETVSLNKEIIPLNKEVIPLRSEDGGNNTKQGAQWRIKLILIG